MKPLDPRLLRYAKAARAVLVIGGVLGLIRTGAVIVWCWSLAAAVSAVVLPILGGAGGASGRIGEGAFERADLPLLVAVAAAALLVRAVSSWGLDVTAATGAIRAKQQLRGAALDRLDATLPGSCEPRRGGEAPSAEEHAPPGAMSAVATTTVLGRGLDALDGYFSQYLPQLILTAVATPILVAVLLAADPVSGLTVVAVFPVIPIFMALIGLATRSVQDRQWRQLQRLAASFLDAVTGLATLKIFRREHRQVARLARETEEYRARTMRVLRVTFLSGFVLDLAGTFSIALVAVTVGTRLVDGRFPLTLGLFVLLLVPEVFIPIRQVGAAYHASTEGLAAADDVFELIESGSSRGTHPNRHGDDLGGEPAAEVLRLDALVVERSGHGVHDPLDLTVARGEIVALTGPSGVGKSSVLAAILGAADVAAGHVRRRGTLSWMGQRADLLAGSVFDNITLGDEAPDARLAKEVLADVGLGRSGETPVDIELGTELGVFGAGISGGQAQRVALARCVYRARRRDCNLLLLDEPSSALDDDAEALVCHLMEAEAARGRGVLVVSHRPRIIETAHRAVRLENARVHQRKSEVLQ